MTGPPGQGALTLGAPLGWRTRRASRAALLGYPALLALVALGCLLAVAGASGASFLVPSGRREFPAWLAGPLAGSDLHLTGHGFVLVLFALCGVYALAIACAPRLSPRALVAAIAAVNVVLVLAPPLLSTDLFSYVAYARLGAIHAINPYVHGPLSAAGDPVLPFVGDMWRRTPSAYGPVFTALSYLFAPLGLPATVWSLKALAGAASLGSVALVWRCAGTLGADRRRAIALVGLNPILLVYGVGGGHNDLLMLFLALLGVTLALEGRQAAGATALVVSAAIKASSGVVVLFLLAGNRRPRAVAGVAIGVLTVGALGLLAFGTHALDFVGTIRAQQHLTSSESWPNGFEVLLGRTAHLQILGGLAFAGALCYLVVRVRRGMSWIAGAGWAMLALSVSTSWLLAWYTLWPLPFAAIARDRRLLGGVLFVQVLFLAHRLPTLAT